MDAVTKHPDRFERAVIVDTGPFDYYDMQKFPITQQTQSHVYKLGRVPTKGRTYSEIKQDVSGIVGGDESLIGFFMTNLVPDETIEANGGKGRRGWRWRVNYGALSRGYYDGLKYQFGGGGKVFRGPVLLMLGTRSAYIDLNELECFERIFPDVDLERDVVEFDSDHWIHIEKPVEFMDAFKEFDES